MTYKTRQEVLRAAADWIDVCEAAGIEAVCKMEGDISAIRDLGFGHHPSSYEFPLALLECKEVWLGSGVYDEFGRFVRAEEFNGLDLKADGRWYNLKSYSWNQPKPKTVMVELLVEDAKEYIELRGLRIESDERIAAACKKALENLK